MRVLLSRHEGRVPKARRHARIGWWQVQGDTHLTLLCRGEYPDPLSLDSEAQA